MQRTLIQRFAQSFWEQAPCVLSSAFCGNSISEDDFFQVIVRYSNEYRSNNSKAQPRLYIDGELQHWESFSQLVADLLPQEADRTFCEYDDRVKNQLDHREYTFNLGNIHQFDRDYWGTVCAFLQELYRFVGLPTDWNGWVDTGAFFGSYRTTPFGVHWGPMSVFTFPCVGTKVFRGWDNNYVTDHPTLEGAHEYSEHLTRSTVLDGTPGDVIYWPAKFWHTAERDTPSFTAAWSIGVWYNHPNASRASRMMNIARALIDEAVCENLLPRWDIENKVGDGDFCVRDFVSAEQENWRLLVSQLDGLAKEGELQRRLLIEMIRQVSACGFTAIPDPISDGPQVTADSICEVDERFPIHLAQIENKVFVACGGYALELEGETCDVERVIGHLGRESSFRVNISEGDDCVANESQIVSVLESLRRMGGIRVKVD